MTESLCTNFIDYIKNNKDQIDNDTIIKAFNTVREKVIGAEIIDNMSPQWPDTWLKELKTLLNNYHYTKKVFNYLKDKSINGIIFDDLEKNKNNGDYSIVEDNIIKVAKNNKSFFSVFNYKENKLKTFLENAYNIEPKTSPKTGKGEFLLTLLLSNASKQIKSPTGDIKITHDNNESIYLEVKGSDGRLLANKNVYLTPKQLLSSFLDKIKFKDNNEFMIGSASRINEMFKSLNEYDSINYTYKYLTHCLFDTYVTQFTIENETFDSSDNCINFLKKQIDEYYNTNKQKEKIGKFIVKLYGILSLYAYWKIEKFTYLILINNATLDYALINFNNAEQTIKDIYKNKSIQFRSSPSTTRGAGPQDYVGFINYIKK